MFLRLSLVLLLTGCSGVQMTAEDRVNCRNVGCAAFSEAEIRQIVGKVYKDAYQQGWVDATKQGSKGI